MDANFRFSLLSVPLYDNLRGKEIEKLESDAECRSWLIDSIQGARAGVSPRRALGCRGARGPGLGRSSELLSTHSYVNVMLRDCGVELSQRAHQDTHQMWETRHGFSQHPLTSSRHVQRIDLEDVSDHCQFMAWLDLYVYTLAITLLNDCFV